MLIIAGAAIAWTASTRIRLAALFAVGALVPLLIVSAVGPLLRSIYPWESFGREIQQAAGPVWMYGYRAPSLTLHAGRPIERLPDLETLDRELAQHPGGWLIVDESTLASPEVAKRLRGMRVRVAGMRARMVLVRVDHDAREPARDGAASERR